LWSDGRRQLDKHLKTIKQRPKVRIVQAENGVGRRVLLPVKVAHVVAVVVFVVVVAVAVIAVVYGKQTMQAFKHLCNIN